MIFQNKSIPYDHPKMIHDRPHLPTESLVIIRSYPHFPPEKKSHICEYTVLYCQGALQKWGGSNTRIIIINNNNLLLIPTIPYNMPLLLKEYAERIYFDFFMLIAIENNFFYPYFTCSMAANFQWWCRR